MHKHRELRFTYANLPSLVLDPATIAPMSYTLGNNQLFLGRHTVQRGIHRVYQCAVRNTIDSSESLCQTRAEHAMAAP